MLIKIKKDACERYLRRCRKYKHASNSGWSAVLSKIEGKTLEVETKHLFKDQYNTVPIPGVSDKGLRVMHCDVEEVIGDIRLGMARCSYCGLTTVQGESCSKCGEMSYLEPIDEYIKAKIDEERERNKGRIKIKVDDGNYVYRTPNFMQVGNFQQMWVRYNGGAYLVGDGDEYIRGPESYDTIFKLGKQIENKYKLK